MDSGTRTGIYFGTTSGVITTLGLVVGLNAGTGSLVAVLGGILVIAVADAMSDALGIHLAQEADADTSDKEVWNAMVSLKNDNMGKFHVTTVTRQKYFLIGIGVGMD